MNISKLGLRIAVTATATTTALALGGTHMAVGQETDLLNAMETLAGVPSDLVVTEILPDTTSYDNFEFFEVHNTGSAPVTIGEGSTPSPIPLTIPPIRPATRHWILAGKSR